MRGPGPPAILSLHLNLGARSRRITDLVKIHRQSKHHNPFFFDIEPFKYPFGLDASDTNQVSLAV